MPRDINRRIVMKKKLCINEAMSTVHAVNTQHLFMLITGRHAKHMLMRSNCTLPNLSFYAYENVMKLLNIVHHYFFCFYRIYVIIAIKLSFINIH